MTGTTISGTYAFGITLSDAATQNPATVTGSGLINVTSASSNGIYGSNATAWSIYNFGTVSARSHGIFLAAGGTVANRAGTISGYYRGIDIIGGTGTVTNAALIAAVKYEGVRLDNGTVSNLSGGTIAGGGTYASVYVLQGGLVENASGATIGNGVRIDGSIGTVMNAGAINSGTSSVAGVQLAAGGTVTNSGSIVAPNAGVVLGAAGVVNNSVGAVINADTAVSLSTGSVSNAGLISSGHTAIAFGQGGTVTNLAGGVLSAAASATSVVIDFGGAGSFDNFGTVNAALTGIELAAGGAVTNEAGATITAATEAILAFGASATVVNDGYITQTEPARLYSVVWLQSGGLVTNTGVISAANNESAIGIVGSGTVDNSGVLLGSVYIGGQATLTNSGTMDGANIFGMATVSNTGSIDAELRLSHGATINNAAGATITGGNYAIYSLYGGILDNHGVIAGQIKGVRMALSPISVVNYGTISGGTALDIFSSMAGQNTVVNFGSILGNVLFEGIAAGLLVVDPGAVFTGTIDGGSVGSSIELAMGNGVADTLAGFGTSIVNIGNIAFDTGASWTIRGNSAGLTGVISGFAQADTIDLTGLRETVQDYANGTLTLVGDRTMTLQLPGSFTKASFQTTPDSGAGTNIFLACFAGGTRIATDQCDVAVEDLLIGDRVRLARSGGLAPIVWIGHRTIDCTRHAKPQTVWPVRIMAGAFAPGVPSRDLWLSPAHAVFVDDVLIPVKHLINGVTIMQVPVGAISYWHVELPAHDVLLAEGLPAESLLDTGDRSVFDNGDNAAVQLHPDFSLIWEGQGCAPLLVAGPEVLDINRRLMLRAARLGGSPERPRRARRNGSEKPNAHSRVQHQGL